MLEAPRAEDDEGSIGEIVQRLTNEIDKVMAATFWKSESSTQVTIPKKKEVREVKQPKMLLNFLSALIAEQIDKKNATDEHDIVQGRGT